MSDANEQRAETVDPDDDCALPPAVQLRNIACIAGYWSLFYLAAPVTYVGTAHANLLKDLGNTQTINNLPSAVYMWFTVVPVILAWIFPQTRLLKPLALVSVAVMAAATAGVALTLWWGFSPRVVTGIVIAHGAAFGGANGVVLTTLWDFLRRSVSTSRRGRALGLTFGIGPLLACVGALLQDAMFKGELLNHWTFGLSFPNNYAVLFGVVAPLLCVSAFFVMGVTLPASAVAATEDESPWRQFVHGLNQFRANRVIVAAIVIYVIVYSGGNAIITNMSLYAKDMLSAQTETVGAQNFLRFGCKAMAGALLGWLLARTNPRATLLATTLTLLAGMGWALASSGWWFLATFGIMGAGELFGAHFPNYVATASSKAFVRVNMAYLSVLSSLVGFSSLAFGRIADRYGLKASFFSAAGLLLAAVVLICLLLPANPTPRESERIASGA